MLNGQTVRVVSQRFGGVKAKAGETVFPIDRTNPCLGNPFFLLDHRDSEQRDEVINLYEGKFLDDIEKQGPMFDMVLGLAKRVASGESLALSCWCATPNGKTRCHGDILVKKILELAFIESEK